MIEHEAPSDGILRVENIMEEIQKREVTILFEPAVLLPAQYYETTKKKFQAMPEKDLALAVLEDAVYSFQKYLLVSDKNGSSFSKRLNVGSSTMMTAGFSLTRMFAMSWE